MTISYPWYEIISNSDNIAQGDVICDCPILIVKGELHPGLERKTVETELKTIDAIVMSQSCDLEQGKVEHVILCGLVNAAQSGQKYSDIDSIKKGRQPAYHLLNSFDDGAGAKLDMQIVDFRNIYSLPIAQLKKIAVAAVRRFRVLPPYREHLAQAFARFFMRIGLPEDIDLSRLKK